MSEKHTIEQRQAMSHEQLAELAARLRGWTLEDDKPPEELLPPIRKSNKWPAWFEAGKFTGFAPHGLPHYLTRWNPAADISQAYGLLRWAKRQGKVGFSISIGRPADELKCFINGYWRFSLPGNGAREMCIAFVMAMEAING